MTNESECTVFAVFDGPVDANAAAAELRDAGFHSEDIYLSSDAEHQSHDHGIADWFKALFVSEKNEQDLVCEHALADGKTIVSVNTPDAHCQCAAQILKSHSPVEVSS
jgi:hypothetical protein